MNQSQRRRAFTLLEVTLATAISATIAGVSLGLFVYFDRTDARLQDRFIQSEQLSRLHLVSERAFSKLLISDKPRILREAEQKARAGTSTGGNEARAGGSSGADDPADNPDELARRASSRDKRVDLKNNPELIAIRAQIPPRLELTLRPDARIEAPQDREATSGTSAILAQRFTEVPQRLELVVTESPVPASSELDDPEALMARVEKQRAREKQQLRRMRAANDTGSGSDGASPDDPAAEDFDFASPVRALRGAFELRPMMPRGEGTSAEVKGWEVWWVPLAPQAGPDEELDEETPELDPPFLVANNIAFIEWRAFQGRVRRTEYAARLNDDIPAYVELEVETVGGLKANWLFELGWTFGHESRAIEPKTLVAGAAAAGGNTPVSPTPVNPGKPVVTPGGGGGSPIAPIPLQPSQPIQPPQGPKPGETPTIKPGGPQPMGPMLPVEKPGKRGKKGT